jgi:type IV secretory pathway VirB10-like protein
VVKRTVVVLFITGLLAFFAAVAIMWPAPEGAVPAPPARPVASIQVMPEARSDAAERHAAARRINEAAAEARERRDTQERALQAGYQDDARQLQAAQERQVEQQLRLRAAEQVAAQEQRALRQEQLAEARRMAADQAAQGAEQQRQLALAQQEKAGHAARVRRMLEQEWLYWRYPRPRLPER